MGKRYDSCIKSVEAKIKSGKISKTYKKDGRRIRTNPYAICFRLR